MISAQDLVVRASERRVARRLAARGLPGLGEALVRLRGSTVGGRWQIDALYAVGAEGAVFTTRNLGGGGAQATVVKIPLLPYHRQRDLTSALVRSRREALREEARHLARAASPYMPASCGLYELTNPLLDRNRGGPFAEPDPVLVMERLAGLDADAWLARVHRSGLDRSVLREHLDGIAVELLHALHDVHERGYFYTDLRPGNLRVAGRPLRRVRLLDAGGLVEVGDLSGRFPHVPHYLPPDLVHRGYLLGLPIQPSAAVEAVMAGRTLYEVATGRVPVPGSPLEIADLVRCGVSPDIADVIGALASGRFSNVDGALRHLSRRPGRQSARAALPPVPQARTAPARFAVGPTESRRVEVPPSARVVPAPPPSAAGPRAAPRGLWRRLVDRLLRRPG